MDFKSLCKGLWQNWKWCKGSKETETGFLSPLYRPSHSESQSKPSPGAPPAAWGGWGSRELAARNPKPNHQSSHSSWSLSCLKYLRGGQPASISLSSAGSLTGSCRRGAGTPQWYPKQVPNSFARAGVTSFKPIPFRQSAVCYGGTKSKAH